MVETFQKFLDFMGELVEKVAEHNNRLRILEQKLEAIAERSDSPIELKKTGDKNE